MVFELALGAGAALAGGFAVAKSRRNRLYARLGDRITAIAGAHPVHIAAPDDAVPDFTHRLAIIPEVLEAATFEALRAEARRLTDAERSYVPAHKQGGTVAYEALIARAPVPSRSITRRPSSG